MTFDWPSFINVVLSALIGVITSWLISHWYYKKNRSTERMLKEIKSVLPSYFHPVIYPQFYCSDALRVSPDQPPPKDLDIPHIEYAIFSKKAVVEDACVEVLFKLRDIGRNLENPSGVSVRDHLERDVAVRSIGLGFAATSFIAELKENRPESHLTVLLEDTSGKRSTQSIPFLIHPR